VSTDEARFFQIIELHPDDDGNWLVYADWLEEQGDPRAEYVRLCVALGRGSYEGEAAHASFQRLWSLRPGMAAEWLARVAQLRANRPARFRITEVHTLGHVPPQEMFDRAMSIIIGYLEAGQLAVGREVNIPLEAGGYLVRRITGMEMFNRSLSQATAGDEPPEFALGWSGHQLAQAGIQQFGIITTTGRD
jgi:uncharacterized protein (TIGR02996 family)